MTTTKQREAEAERNKNKPPLRALRGRRGGKRTHNKRAYKSGFEEKFAEQTGLPYEQDKIKYTIPEKVHTYTPDFKVTKNRYIETKGQWTLKDRQKALLLLDQHPEIEILYILYRDQKLSKKSKTTYTEWASKNGILCCLFSEVDLWQCYIKENTPNAST